jgi:hypothetical protein
MSKEKRKQHVLHSTQKLFPPCFPYRVPLFEGEQNESSFPRLLHAYK